MSQVVNEVESGQSSVEESMATDMTVVGGNVSDFVSKEPQNESLSYFETDATIMNQDVSPVVEHVDQKQQNLLANDVTIVGDDVTPNALSSPKNFEAVNSKNKNQCFYAEYAPTRSKCS